MIYTCYEMIRDCRADLSEGWSYFIVNYVPIIRKLLTHYAGDDAALLERVLLDLREPSLSLFQSLDPAPERPFVAELRQKVAGRLEPPPADIELDLPTVAAALAPLTLLEKQAAWFETMRYDGARTAAMLRMSPETVVKIRRRASELIRGAVDAWRTALLAENGVFLGRAAAASAGEACIPAKTFLEAIDGRMTWRDREEMERHAAGCWHCVDHFCRMLEVVELLRDLRPLTEPEAVAYRKLLRVETPRRPLWKRWGGGA